MVSLFCVGCDCSIISSSIQLLVQDMENACVSAFNAMVKVREGGGRGEGKDVEG